MAEFGAKLCSYPGCRQHDFLPYACPACRQVFCSDHMAIGSGHRCDQGEEYLASRMGEGGRTAAPGSHPLSLSKPSEVMSAVTSRFDGREKELNAATTHYNIKASEGGAGEGSAGAPDKLLENSQLAMDKAATEKGKRVSTQVHRMLLKAKAVGDKKLRMEDRFFLEVHYCGNDTNVHHLFFSRLWTVGRALDDILKTRRRHLRLKAGEEARPLELARVGASSGLPTGGILNNLPPEQLQSFDAVMVRPRTLPPAGSSASDTSAEGGSSDSAVAAPGLNVEGAPDDLKGSGIGGDEAPLEQQQRQTGHVLSICAVGAKASGCEEAGAGSGVTSAAAGTPATNASGGASEEGGGGGGMTITVGHGKSVYELGGVMPDRMSVLELKRRLEPITGVPFLRQKLLFKGILRDGDKIGATKIVEGAKVMLLGTAAAAAKK
ncbi:unnamed protein product [Ectocarpus sp. 8 AP-2014]